MELTNEMKNNLQNIFQNTFNFDADKMYQYTREHYSYLEDRLKVMDFVLDTQYENRFNQYKIMCEDFFVKNDFNVFKLNDYLKYDLKLTDNLRAELVRAVENNHKEYFGENLRNYISFLNENNGVGFNLETQESIKRLYNKFLSTDVSKNRVGETIPSEKYLVSIADSLKDLDDRNFEKNAYMLFKALTYNGLLNKDVITHDFNDDENLDENYTNYVYESIDRNGLELSLDGYKSDKDMFDDSNELALRLTSLLDVIDPYEVKDNESGNRDNDVEDVRKSILTLTGINAVKRQIMLYSENGFTAKEINFDVVNTLSMIDEYINKYKDTLSKNDLDTHKLNIVNDKLESVNVNDMITLVNSDLGLRYMDFNDFTKDSLDYKLIIAELNNVLVNNYGLFGFKNYLNLNQNFNDKMETYNYLYDTITNNEFASEKETLNNIGVVINNIPQTLVCNELKMFNNFLGSVRERVLYNGLNNEQEKVNDIIKDNNYNIGVDEIKKKVDETKKFSSPVKKDDEMDRIMSAISTSKKKGKSGL